MFISQVEETQDQQKRSKIILKSVFLMQKNHKKHDNHHNFTFLTKKLNKFTFQKQKKRKKKLKLKFGRYIKMASIEWPILSRFSLLCLQFKPKKCILWIMNFSFFLHTRKCDRNVWFSNRYVMRCMMGGFFAETLNASLNFMNHILR